jgi:uncharacterized protein with PIN domain
MGGYDLNGRWYAKEADAINAETAQMAEIDARIALTKVQNLERKSRYEESSILSKIRDLENRLTELEALFQHLNKKL